MKATPLAIASSLIETVRKERFSREIHMYGCQRDPHHSVDMQSSFIIHIFTGDPTFQHLEDVFQKICKWQDENASGNRDDNGNGGEHQGLFDFVYKIVFNGFDFTLLPSNVGLVFRHIWDCQIINCHKLISLGTLVKQFPELRTLTCDDCKSLSSLASLADIPQTSPLFELGFQSCGLELDTKYGDNDEWDEGMRALGNTESDDILHIRITDCNFLKALPSSIHHLKQKKGVIITLTDNEIFQRIPYSIGALKNLNQLRIICCPKLNVIPWTLSNVNPHCKIELRWIEDNHLFNNLCHVSAGLNIGVFGGHNYFAEGTIEAMELYFRISQRRQLVFSGIVKLSILFQRARIRAIDRLYAPGGAGYIRAKEQFEKLSDRENIRER